ncbi:MAG: hypothetical protein D8M57_16175 [Candidatus Scalindua sp. AMX11]|nr:MAG: hypothetical protein DWQ00_03645 [Candidatus Scalindua sp.]TDE63870.1 MAG: hypothetical protein D8M57_16175 [Candidatus Scalindua sp. AMX11]
MYTYSSDNDFQLESGIKLSRHRPRRHLFADNANQDLVSSQPGLSTVQTGKTKNRIGFSIRNILIAILLFSSSLAIICLPTYAHHGGISTAFGPGSPVETASPMTLGKGKFLLYERIEYVSFRERNNAEPENIDTFAFFNTLAGLGLTDALSLYITIPVAIKEQDSLGKSSGFGDLEFVAQYGFKLGERDGIRGLYRNGPDDSDGAPYTTDDLKMSFTGSGSLPIGTTSNNDDLGNRFDIGLQPGFGAPSFSLGFSASQRLLPYFTLTADTSIKTFLKYKDKKAGNEIRFNVAGGFVVYENRDRFLSRVDIITEANGLHLTKDRAEDNKTDHESGGTILYLSPGFRMSLGQHISVGTLIKFPVWQSLNNESLQQGSEGLENYRAILTFTVSF